MQLRRVGEAPFSQGTPWAFYFSRVRCNVRCKTNVLIYRAKLKDRGWHSRCHLDVSFSLVSYRDFSNKKKRSRKQRTITITYSFVSFVRWEQLRLHYIWQILFRTRRGNNRVNRARRASRSDVHPRTHVTPSEHREWHRPSRSPRKTALYCSPLTFRSPYGVPCAEATWKMSPCRMNNENG